MVGKTQCLTCATNTFALEFGSVRCSQCAIDTFAAAGAARCSDCWQNYIASNGVYLSKKGDTRLGYSIIPTLFLSILFLVFVFCLLSAYELYRYFAGKRTPSQLPESGFRAVTMADIVPEGGPA